MSRSRFYLCAVPAPAWIDEAGGLARFVADALGSERRIGKEINLENELGRYTLTCRRLEQVIMRSGRLAPVTTHDEFRQKLGEGRLPAYRLDEGYLALLAQLDPDEDVARLGCSFFPPQAIATHRDTFARWAAGRPLAAGGTLADTPVVRQRLAFLEWVQAAACGLVELQTTYDPPGADAGPLLETLRETAEEPAFTIPDDAAEIAPLSAEESRDTKARLAHILRRQIREALAAGEPVTFGSQANHEVITQVLHEFVYAPGNARPVSLRVAYVDGSEAEPFPLFCLAVPPAAPPAAEPLRVALMSMRHLELDSEVDYCWFRNREVSRARSMAETDHFCWTATREQLDESLALGDLAIHLYHTGFEPAVIGFYRAVAQRLVALRAAGRPALAITPIFLHREGYEAGRVWH